MEARELRIGNYIASGAIKEDPETWVIGQVYSISNLECEFEQLEVETEDEFTWFFKDSYWGVPLTQEWLVKFGFVKTENVLAYPECFPTELFFDKDLMCYIDADAWISVNAIKQVHELQNLFYSMSGQELTLKSNQ